MSSVRCASFTLVLASFLAACGTTVPPETMSQGATGIDPYAGSDMSAPPGLVDPATSNGDSAAEPGRGEGEGGAAGPAGSSVQLPQGNAPTTLASPRPGSGPATGAAASGPASGVGFTQTTAHLGIAYVTGGDEAARAAGFSLTTGNPKELADALIKRLNADGGILGRKIVPVYHETKAADQIGNAAATDQAACATFTQDHKVFAVVRGNDCVGQRRVPWTKTGIQNAMDDQGFAARAPYFYDPNSMVVEDEIPLQLDRAIARGFLTTSSKIGIYYYVSSAADRRIAAQYKKALQARGLNIAATYENDQNVSDASGAVLQMKAAGVDRIVSWQGATAYFMMNAESQQYRPKYLLSTYMNLASVMESVPPKAQLRGSFGIGWQPPNDVDSAQQVKLSGTALCDQALADSGQSDPQGAAAFILYSYCDSIQLFVLGARAGGSPTPEGIRGGLTKLGPDFPTALNFRPAYGEGRYSGALAAREVAFNDACECFKYQGTTLYGR